MSEQVWRDEEGRLCFSASGPCTREQVELVETVLRGIGLEGSFDALVGWMRDPTGRPHDVPVLRSIVAAYQLGRAHAAAGA